MKIPYLGSEAAPFDEVSTLFEAASFFYNLF